MLLTTTIKRNREALYLGERCGLAIDRIRAVGSFDVVVPSVDLGTLAKIIVQGEGEFDIVNKYNADV